MAAWKAPPQSHTAYFYRNEDILHHTIAAYFADGLRQGDPLVMISRARTYEAVNERLAHDVDLDRNAILFMEVGMALAEFMDGDKPDAARFEQGMARLLGIAQSNRPGIICVYGEIVDVLCRNGNHQGAVRLEELWNSVASKSDPVSVLCGYAVENFDDDPNAVRFHAICRQHSHIIPAETVADGTANRAGVVPILKAEPAGKDPVPLAGTTIYIIDDDDSVRRSLARLLGSMELKVRTFASAEEFLAEIGESPKGCLIVDVQLVGMSGSDLQGQLAEARWPLPVIAMSGSHDSQIEIEALRLGARAFLCKPFDLQSLLDAIARALS